MERPSVFRRVFHATGALYLIYYLMPDRLIFDFYKWQGVIILVAAAWVVEAIRLKRKTTVFGMREYEQRRPSAYAWFALGAGLALLLFKMIYVVPVVIGMATIDPLIGELRCRKNKLYPVLPTMLYGVIMFTCFILLSDQNILFMVLFAIAGTLTAIYAESWDIRAVDDDFLMIIVPLVLLTILDFIASFF